MTALLLSFFDIFHINENYLLIIHLTLILF